LTRNSIDYQCPSWSFETGFRWSRPPDFPAIASRDYITQNKGKYDEIDKQSMPMTPTSIKEIYDELLGIFQEDFNSS